MPSHTPTIATRRAIRLAVCGLMIAGGAGALGGCNTLTAETTSAIHSDYRERHPIAITEGKETLELFVGAGRGGLSPMQRAEVLAFAQNWKREATGSVRIDQPLGSSNERAARDTLNEVLSIVGQAGVPSNAIERRPYRLPRHKLATLRLSYPRMKATTGPCGVWPNDLGPTNDPAYFENDQYWNLGCATQRNIAAMVENPADLVQPRAEAPAYTAKRNAAIDKWRKGNSPATIYPQNDKGAISDVGK
jgi:pilus assembly protein CpaD